jgi:hypothetical protein
MKNIFLILSTLLISSLGANLPFKLENALNKRDQIEKVAYFDPQISSLFKTYDYQVRVKKEKVDLTKSATNNPKSLPANYQMEYCRKVEITHVTLRPIGKKGIAIFSFLNKELFQVTLFDENDNTQTLGGLKDLVANPYTFKTQMMVFAEQYVPFIVDAVK